VKKQRKDKESDRNIQRYLNVLKGVQAASLRFLLDGERILDDQTPRMLELDDGSRLIMLEQTGCCRQEQQVQLRTMKNENE
jgi:hypothetical protein